MSDDWYTDANGVTRRSKSRGKIWEIFWAAFLVINAISILALVGVTIWAIFDIEGRIDYVFMAQIPPIAMMIIRRVTR